MTTMAVQIIQDGPRNTVLKVDLLVDTNDIVPTVILDPKARFIDPLTPTTQYRLDYVNYIIQDGLSVDLWWEGTPNKSILHLEGRGNIDMESRSGINNDAPGKTGAIMLSTQGWSSGLSLASSMTIEAIKQ